ncbi:hypothetical protein [Streptomyces sp. CB01881]|uniref:hypothetical protein n=1 Tax=Streptomyces sp. CB01881 TaxID=2078691 RepID=UPI0011E016A6|nr:hypothetical protein [Streptomyces sp. CB01881]TYC70440.1 hypothetical protein EH183_31765 [Streptomyces sp. CB01881]
MEPDGRRPGEFIAALVREGAEVLPGPPALAVPAAPADEVIAAARRLALAARPQRRPGPAPAPTLLRLATALVVDEHPSAPAWSEAERERLAGWVAVLIEHRGEDGVEELVGALNGG